MLDPRIYRAGLIVIALAVVVVAFSLVDQQGPLGTSLAPDAFSGQNASALTSALAARHPDRAPGSPGDAALAASVAARLNRLGYHVSTASFTARTAVGGRTLENVVATRAGLTPGAIVVVSHRDAPRGTSPVVALSGTGVMLELARVLAGESEHHSIVLVSTSGADGAAGASELARTLSRPVDAVIALGDLASNRPREPIVLPWSDGDAVAPTLLRTTVGAALSGQAGLRPGGSSLPSQLLHLAVPASLAEQAPFGSQGIPAVTVSLSGDRPPGPGADPQSGELPATGRAILTAIDALDGGGPVPSPSPYLLFSGKVIPDWALRLLVLALLLPVLPAAVDGFARARRRGHAAELGVLRALAAGIPFLLAAGLVVLARVTGVLDAAPPGPVAPGAVHLGGAGIAVMAVVLIVCTAGVWLWVRAGGVPPRHPAGEPDPGSGVGTLITLWLVALAVWVVNPYAAILTVPALHLWMWLLDGELRPPRAVVAMLWLGGLALPVLAAIGYASTLGLGPVGLAWNGLLLLAGGALSPALAVTWCLLLGGTVAVAAAAFALARAPRPEAAPVTVRGPVTYAGPGSLGGTKSALRR